MNNSGGTACPVQWFFVTMKSPTEAQVSPEFGTCSDLIETSQTADQIVVTMPGPEGMKAKFALADGWVTENGTPIK